MSEQPTPPTSDGSDRSDDGSESAPEGHSSMVIAGATEDGRGYVVTPQSMAVEQAPEDSTSKDTSVTDQVEEPAKVMRIGTMVRALLEEVRNTPLDEPSRARLRESYQNSITELKSGLSEELADELERIVAPFTDERTPSNDELRIAQAQLVGWLEGLFQGIQTALVAQQVAARAQLEQMRKALPGGPPNTPGEQSGNSGMYL